MRTRTVVALAFLTAIVAGCSGAGDEGRAAASSIPAKSRSMTAASTGHSKN